MIASWASRAILLFACSCLLMTSANAQSRFSDDTLRAWAAEADGHSCDTQLDGFLAVTASTFVYPERAFADQISGDVLLLFDTRAGDTLSVVNPRVFASEPTGVFDAAALDVVRHFRFPEGMRDCEGLRVWLKFRVNNANSTGEMRGFLASAEALPPLSAEAEEALAGRRAADLCGPALPARGMMGLVYPPDAFRAQQEGSAVVRFSVSVDGSVSDLVIIDELPAGWGFGDAAVRALQRTTYPARDSVCEDVVTQVHFRMQ